MRSPPTDHHFLSTRYAPPPPSFSGDPHHHNHNHLPPPHPPHQPLPPPPTYRNNPSQPPPQQSPHPYNLHHPSQFNFPIPNPSPNQDDSPRSFHHRLAFQDDRPARHLAPAPDRLYPENRPDVWDPSRVAAYNRSARPYPPEELDRGSQHPRSFVQRPSPPSRRVEVFRHEPEGSSRSREEQHDQHSQREKYGPVWGRSNDGQRRGSNSDRSGRSFGFNNEHNSSSTRGAEHNSSSTRGAEHSSSSRGIQPNYTSRGVESSSSLRGFESNSASYDSRYGVTSESELGRGGRDEHQRWVQSRQSLKDGRDQSFNMVHSEVNAADGGRIFSRKEEYNASESGRYMENSHEYVERPRKQVQKKSALLRIQMAKPNHKNVDNEQSQYSDYFGDSNSNSFRGKDQLSYSGHGRQKEEEREGSPVELDVSFKSNSLVAKAIVTPPSSKVPSDTNLTPRNRKIRKVIPSVRDCSGSILNKFEENASRSDSARSVVNNTPSSGRDLKQSEKKVTDSASVTKSATSSQPCCDGMNNLVAKAQVEGSLTGINTDKSGANAVSAKTSTPKIVKRRKVVKKIIRKVMKPVSRLSSSQLAKKGEEPIKAGSSTASGSNQHLKDSKEGQLCAGMTSMHNVDLLQPDRNKVTVLSEGNKVDGSPQAIVSEERDNVANSVGRTVDVLTSLSSSSHEIKTYEDPTIADASGHHLRSILNSHGNILKTSIEATCSDAHIVEEVGKQISDSVDSILIENGGEKESQHIMFSAEGNATSDFSCLGDKKFSSAVLNTYPAREMNKDLDFDIGLVSLQGKPALLDSDPNVVNQQLCANDAPTILENDSVEALPKSIVSTGIRDIVAASSSVETTIHSDPINGDCAEQGRDTMSGPGNGSTSLEEIATFNNVMHDDICKQTSPCVVTPSLDTGAMKGSPNTKVSEVGRDIDRSKSKKKRKLKSSQFDLSSSSIINEDAGFLNLVSPVQAVDPTFILSSKDSSPAEVTVSGWESLVVDLRPATSGANVLNRNTTNGSFSEVPVESDGSVDPNVSSPKYKNKRKFSALHRGLSGNGESLNVNTPEPGKETLTEGYNGQEEKVAASGIIVDPCTASLPPMSGGDVSLVSPVRDASGDDSSKIELLISAPGSAVQDMDIPNPQSVCLPVFGENEEENDNLITAIKYHENVDVESCRGDQHNVHCAEEQVVMGKETQPRISLELQSPGIDEGFPSTDMEQDSCLQVKDYLADVPNCQSLYVDEYGISTSNSNDELMELGPGGLSNICSPEIVTDVKATLKCKESFDEHAGEKVYGSDKELAQNPLVEGSNTSTSSSFSKQSQIASLNPYHGTTSAHSITLKTTPSQSQNCKKMSHYQNSLGAEPYLRKSQVGKTIPRTLPAHPFAYTNSKKTSSTPVTKPRTWHRNTTTSLPSLPPNKSFSNMVSQQRQLSEKSGKFQSTSYIRKGNSLVRQPTPVAVLAQGSDVSSTTRLNSSSIDDSKKGTGSDRVDVIDPSNVLRTGSNVLSEIHGTSTVPNSIVLPNHSTTSSGTCTLSTSAEPDLSGCCESLSDPIKSTEPDLMKSHTPEDQSAPISNVGSQSESMKRITYVKRKSNQLVAASNKSDVADKTQVLYADGYYKRRKNQLIRTPSESQKKADDSSNSEGQKVSKVIPTRSPSKKQSLKVAAKTSKPSKFSLVWTLRGTQTSSKDGGLLHRQFLPYTPYKRATSWRSFIQNSASISNSSSLSLTRKLLLSRKMNTVYTRSKHGFSLRKSKVLSVGGSSLKWSKSIERRAKMVNEEATLAVAAADKKKREQNGAAACALNRTKNKRQRIFRIGSVRYKMDSSRRTLQRISDDESSHVTASQSKNNLKKSYVPRRLLIGNDEYVRIGNGNQLVRDPKKRTRALASEKVRWSLHTARSRLARKRKYCLFFTRFGKCNKDDGKCPYIHDPSKIAVCTKFLNGFCSDPNCKLTHEVIPERMPDCSYFLQGLCTSEKCPYRHVNVNHNAPTCEGFLKGYCVDGDECRKKHSYICPDYESTGSCLQGSKCKLHHPKNRGKGKKRKQSEQQKNARGRYFGLTCNSSETGSMVSERHAQTNDDIVFEGEIGDYISLGVGASDDEAGEGNGNLTNSVHCNSSSSDVLLQDLDSLIKPIRIMT